MDSNFLQSYINDNTILAKTLLIKSSVSSDTINDYIRLTNGSSAVDDGDPTSWKYYLNISGSYHPLDTPMTVTSLDTLEDIIFSKENLSVHITTAEAYEYGSRYYYSLVNKYPNQEQLILGILYPCDITEAIEAEDGTILSYPHKLVEEQETTLILDLEDFIKRYLVRWNVKTYGLSDTLYNVSYHAVLYLNILPKLLNLRLARCKTEEAHSFHIKEYLASHTNLDIYIPYMTLKQKLWLYRNIRYIFRNNGTIEQFKTLVVKLLTDRRIPLNEFSVRQLNGFDSNYYPELSVRRKAINNQYNIPEKDYFTIDELNEIEKPLVYGNDTYIDANKEKVSLSFKTSISNAIQSKDLESNMIDYNDAVPMPLESVLLSLWVNMASEGLYDVVVNFKDPRTSEIISLYAMDAFIYMYYISLNASGVQIDTIPNYINIKSHKLDLVTIDEMLSVTDSTFKDLKDIGNSILGSQPPIVPTYSISNFFDLGYNLFKESYKHWFIVSSTQDLYKRALVENMILTLYEDKNIKLANDNININDWLTERNLEIYNFNSSDAEQIIQNIFLGATGLVIDNSKLLKYIQKAMINILSQLSSYSVQFITKINDSGIKPLNWAAIRVGNIKIETEHKQFVRDEILVNGLSSTIKSNSSVEADITVDDTISVSQSSRYVIETDTVVISKNSTATTITAPMASLIITADYPEKSDAIYPYSNFIGMEYYLILSDMEKTELKSIYS